jgi:hypothetical protein
MSDHMQEPAAHWSNQGGLEIEMASYFRKTRLHLDAILVRHLFYPIAKKDMPINIMIAAMIFLFASASFKRPVPKKTPKTMLSSRAGAT